MADAGFEQNYDFELHVRCSLFTGASPAKNDEIHIVNTLKPGKPKEAFRVERITVSEDLITYTYGLVEA